MKHKNFILVTGIIALYFLWGGSAYISQMYRLYGFLSPEKVDLIAMGVNYTSQAIGIILFSLFLWYNPTIGSKSSLYVIGMFINTIIITLMLTLNNLFIIILSGIIMNIFLGVFAAYQFTILAAHVPQQMRGRAFGFAYAIGSIGTYLISIMRSGKMMETRYVLIIYIGLILINIKLISMVQVLPISGHKKRISLSFLKKGSLFKYFTVFLLMSLINSIGSNYQSAAIFHGKINFELARAFYAIGLIAAGIITDKSRKYGALFCLSSLFFPFVAIALYKEPSLIFTTWALSYLLLGFYSVYRVITFVDIAGKDTALLPLAGIGLCIGRIGEILGTFINNILATDSIYTIILIVILFMGLIILFFNLYQKLYMEKQIISRSMEDIYREFEITYSFTSREREIFRYIIKGYSNGEIANLAYISENTVKFHIKNILKKTNCANRNDVIDLLQNINK